MKIQLHIMTHNRPEWCYYLLQQIKEQQGNHDINVVVFHDKCTSDYSESINFCKANGWKFMTTKEHLGKWQHWRFLNLSYKWAQGLKYDYFITLPDDVVLVNNFFDRACSMPSSLYPMVNFFTLNIHYDQFIISKKRKTINSIEYFLSGWVDCCFIALPVFMEGLKIDEPKASRDRKNMRGTGCAFELINYYKTKFRNESLQPIYALCEHIGNMKTAMHVLDRKRKLYSKFEKDPLECYLHESDKEFIQEKILQFGIRQQW